LAAENSSEKFVTIHKIISHHMAEDRSRGTHGLSNIKFRITGYRFNDIREEYLLSSVKDTSVLVLSSFVVSQLPLEIFSLITC
jgi:hypothetical protein